jgi:hypothetical protein
MIGEVAPDIAGEAAPDTAAAMMGEAADPPLSLRGAIATRQSNPKYELDCHIAIAARTNKCQKSDTPSANKYCLPSKVRMALGANGRNRAP